MLFNSFKRLILSSSEDNIKVRILSLKISVVIKEQTSECYLVEFLAIDVFSFFVTLRKQPTFRNSITGFPATSSPGCFPPGKSALGTRLGFPRNKACDGVAKCRLFSVSSAPCLPASPYEHVFLVKENLQKHNLFASYAVSV